MGVNRRVRINMQGIEELHHKMKVAVEKTAEETITDLKNSATIPFDVGTLQRNTFWDKNAANENSVFLVSNTPYARRLYFHPEYNFRTTNNANAGAGWFEPYINGVKSNFIPDTFAKFMREGER